MNGRWCECDPAVLPCLETPPVFADVDCLAVGVRTAPMVTVYVHLIEPDDACAQRLTSRICACIAKHGPISATGIARILAVDPSMVYASIKASLARGRPITIIPGFPRRYSIATIKTEGMPKHPPVDLTLASLLRFYGHLDDMTTTGTTRLAHKRKKPRQG